MSDANPPSVSERSMPQTSFFPTAVISDNVTQQQEQPFQGETLLYTHTSPDNETLEALRAANPSQQFLVCVSLDELMSYMESDAVDEIIFEQSVNAQEMNYLSRWARIFKPTVRCVRAGSPKNTAFFSDQQN